MLKSCFFQQHQILDSIYCQFIMQLVGYTANGANKHVYNSDLSFNGIKVLELCFLLIYWYVI
jgi:hypothetical protein